MSGIFIEGELIFGPFIDEAADRIVLMPARVRLQQRSQKGVHVIDFGVSADA
jgi:hypothetical protein